MKKYDCFWILVLFLCLSLAACQKRKEVQRPSSDDFESLTGKNLPTWSYIQTKEDFEHLDLFKRMYELKKGLISASNGMLRVPKIIHFVWIGPRPFPRESVENVRTWMAKHPNWTFN